MMKHETQQHALRITDKLRRAVYRKSCQLLKEGWQKTGEIKRIVITIPKSKDRHIIYSQDFIRQ